MVEAIGCLVVLVSYVFPPEWLTTYETIGSDIAGFNNPDWLGSRDKLGQVREKEMAVMSTFALIVRMQRGQK